MTDTISMDVPLFIRLLEYAREDSKKDIELHVIAERAVKLGSKTLTMSDYEKLTNNIKEEKTMTNEYFDLEIGDVLEIDEEGVFEITSIDEETVEMVNEEGELFEISRGTLLKYVDAAVKDKKDMKWLVGRGHERTDLPKPLSKQIDNRAKGIDLARAKMRVRVAASEGVNDESELLDEISKKTLASYIPKAANSLHVMGMNKEKMERATDAYREGKNAANHYGGARTTSSFGGDDIEKQLRKRTDRLQDKSAIRYDGIRQATKRLAKEDVELPPNAIIHFNWLNEAGYQPNGQGAWLFSVEMTPAQFDETNSVIFEGDYGAAYDAAIDWLLEHDVEHLYLQSLSTVRSLSEDTRSRLVESRAGKKLGVRIHVKDDVDDGELLDEAAKTHLGRVRGALGHIADQVGKNKEGHIVARRGFFYRNGGDSEKFASQVSNALSKAGVKHTIVHHDEHWAPFKGGASTAKQSHWAAHIKVHDDVNEDFQLNELTGKGKVYDMGWHYQDKAVEADSKGDKRGVGENQKKAHRAYALAHGNLSHAMKVKKTPSREFEESVEEGDVIELDEELFDVVAITEDDVYLGDGEDIFEISKDTLRRYIPQAVSDIRSRDIDAGKSRGKFEAKHGKSVLTVNNKMGNLRNDKNYKDWRDKTNKAASREQYIQTAADKLGGSWVRVHAKEETARSIANINDPSYSYNQLDEISKKMLGRYIKAAVDDKEQVKDRARDFSKMGWDSRAEGDHEGAKKWWHKAGGLAHKEIGRSTYIRKAVDRLTKEETAQSIADINDPSYSYNQLDELKGSTLGSYIQKAHDDVKQRRKRYLDLQNNPSVKKWDERARATYLNRDYSAANRKKRETAHRRSTEAMDKADPGWYKSQLTANRRNKYIEKAADRLRYNKKLTKEGFEQLDEISKAKLSAYIDAAHKDMSKSRDYAYKKDWSEKNVRSPKKRQWHIDRMNKRAGGMTKALMKMDSASDSAPARKEEPAPAPVKKVTVRRRRKAKVEA